MTFAKPDVQDSFEETDMSCPSVWLRDGLSFTPWYTAALAESILAAGAKVRLICNELAREPSYFARRHLKPDPGPFRFADVMPARAERLRRAARLVDAVANISVHSRGLREGNCNRPDVIHLQQMPLLNHGLRFDFRLLQAARNAGIPLVYTVHNLLPHSTGSNSRTLYAELYTLIDHFICHSADVAGQLQLDFHISPERVSVIPHGPLFAPKQIPTPEVRREARLQLGLPMHRPILLYQGMIAEYKGIDILLAAWDECQLSSDNKGDKRPLLVIAGSGSSALEKFIRFKAEQSDGTVAAQLRYLQSGELEAYYGAADALIYPYRAITTSGALLTGLSYGIPTIASDLAPFREYLTHGENALLCPSGDVTSLAQAIDLLFFARDLPRSKKGDESSRSVFNHLAANAKSNASRLTGWPEIGRRTVALYRTLTLDAPNSKRAMQVSAHYQPNTRTV